MSKINIKLSKMLIGGPNVWKKTIFLSAFKSEEFLIITLASAKSLLEINFWQYTFYCINLSKLLWHILGQMGS